MTRDKEKQPLPDPRTWNAAEIAFSRRCIWMLDVNRHLFRGAFVDQCRQIIYNLGRNGSRSDRLPECTLDALAEFCRQPHDSVGAELIAWWAAAVRFLKNRLVSVHVYQIGYNPDDRRKRRFGFGSGTYAWTGYTQKLSLSLRATSKQMHTRWVYWKCLEVAAAVGEQHPGSFNPCKLGDGIMQTILECLRREGWPKPTIGWLTPYSLGVGIHDLLTRHKGKRTTRSGVRDAIAALKPLGVIPFLPDDLQFHTSVATDVRPDEMEAMLGAGLKFQPSLLRELARASSPRHLEIGLRYEAQNINQKSSYDGKSPLHLATHRGLPGRQCARMLVAAGAEIDPKDYDGDSPVLLAAREGAFAVMVDLIRAGADARWQGANGDDCFAAAIQSVPVCPRSAVRCVRWLIENGYANNSGEKAGVSSVDFLRRVIRISGGNAGAQETLRLIQKL